MTIEAQIRELAASYAQRLEKVTNQRIQEMEHDDEGHFLIYEIFGISRKEGRLIDIYQNKGRFLYKYAGTFLEEATKLCFKHAFPSATSMRIPNTSGNRPKTFEIDCLVENDAIEIKWRDATTDGDHIMKEHLRLATIANAGYTPIRIMFFYPNRTQAIRIQKTLETLYIGLQGYYYYADSAWNYVYTRTGVNLKHILDTLAEENTNDLSAL